MKKKAFKLVEMILVDIIIVVLAAMVVPRLTGRSEERRRDSEPRLRATCELRSRYSPAPSEVALAHRETPMTHRRDCVARPCTVGGRTLTGAFVSTYTMSDVTLLGISFIQGLLFYCWRETKARRRNRGLRGGVSQHRAERALIQKEG